MGPRDWNEKALWILLGGGYGFRSASVCDAVKRADEIERGLVFGGKLGVEHVLGKVVPEGHDAPRVIAAREWRVP